MSPEVVKDINDYTIAKAFCWTLEYVRELSPFDYHQILGTISGWDKARARAMRKK